MRPVAVLSVVVFALAGISIVFRGVAVVSEKKVRMSRWPVRSWSCASLMLMRMIGCIVLFQAAISDVLPWRRSSSVISNIRLSMASMSELLAISHGHVLLFCLSSAGTRLVESVISRTVCDCASIFP
jgi:hypothetical protein